MSDLAHDVERVLRAHLRYLPDDEPLDRTARLSDMGLDSISAVDLMVDLERTFDVRFPDDMLTPATFRTATAVHDAIRSLTTADGR